MKSIVSGCLCIIFLFTTSSAIAKESPWKVRGRIINVSPNDSSSEVAGFGAGSALGVDGATTLEVDFTYMLKRNLSLELILATTKHDINGAGVITSAGKVGSTGVLPPTLTLQYHFSPGVKIRPYAGAGLNYTIFYGEKTEGALNGTNLELDDSIGLAVQVGVDIDMSPTWFANIDIKYIQIDTTANVNGAEAATVDINPIVFGVGIGTAF